MPLYCHKANPPQLEINHANLINNANRLQPSKNRPLYFLSVTNHFS